MSPPPVNCRLNYRVTISCLLFTFVFLNCFQITKAQNYAFTQFGGSPVKFKNNGDSTVYIRNSVIILPPIFAFNIFTYRDSSMKSFEDVGMFGQHIEKYFINDSSAIQHYSQFRRDRKTAFICKAILFPSLAAATMITAKQLTDARKNSLIRNPGPPGPAIALAFGCIGSAIVGSAISFAAKTQLKKAINCMRTKPGLKRHK